MKRIKSEILLDDLMDDVRKIIAASPRLTALPDDILQAQPSPGQWSVAQTIEHLNFYSRYYLKAIEEALHRNQSQPADIFKSGWFGNYFTKMMKPSADNTVKNKMKTMKSAIPDININGQEVLKQFIADQHVLLNLLQIARSANLNKLRVPTSISKMIKLKLGDTFRFFIAHEQRHFIQISNALLSYKQQYQPSK
ncbi:MAG: DinB family protein [Chitinophagaceae bacterium]|nr:DinB family protein [Chitinophagaceae bacterium]